MKIGDKVSVVDEDLAGVITSVHTDTIVFQDDFGFTHQYPKDKLVVQDADLYKNMKVKDKYEYTKPKSKKHSNNQMVLDLHFDKMVNNPEDYESFERLFLQKEKLIETLDFCRKNKIKRLEIIHGLGDGTLQNLVLDTLKSQTNLDFYNKEILHHQSGAVIVEFS
ncbi:MAG: Smr/MutS family protein [Bergeyella zoohelcum]|nr:Smr/MutS family protein [Bergeyella zoohelcum]